MAETVSLTRQAEAWHAPASCGGPPGPFDPAPGRPRARLLARLTPSLTPSLTLAALPLAALFVLAPFASPAHATNTSLPTYISTPEGWKHAENDYLPGVVHRELGWFAGQTQRGRRTECLKAQAVAARTYVLRWLNANGHGRTIPALGPTFQAYTSQFSSFSRDSSQASRGQVMTWQGKVIFSNYVSGAWPLDGNGRAFAPSRYGFPSSYTWTYIRDQYLARQRGQISTSTWQSRVTRYSSWAWTQILWTDNEGRSGADVTATIHASRTERNRGGLGQYRAWWLDFHRSYGHVAILRAFYGADVTVVGAAGGTSTGGGGTTTGGGTTSGAARPDLVVASIRVQNGGGSDDLLGTGHGIRLSAIVRNQGNAMSQSAPISVSFSIAGQRVGTGVRAVALARGQEVEVALGSSWTPQNPGTVAIRVEADDTRTIAETNESNNTLSVNRTVYTAVRVTAGGLNVRRGASTGYGVLAVIRSGQTYVARERQGDWYRIDLAGGTTGWCHGGYLARPQGVQAVVVDANALNVRTGPSTGYRSLGTSSKSQVYVQQRAEGGWSLVSWRGDAGWMSSRYLLARRL